MTARDLRLRSLVLIGLATLCVLAVPRVAFAYDAVVPDEFPTIQAAVFFASDRDGDGIRDVYIRPGFYYENVIIHADNPDLLLEGDDPVTTQIVGAGSAATVLVDGAENITLRSLTITGDGTGVGIHLLNAKNVRIELDIIRDNRVGLYLQGVEKSIVRSNDVRSNARIGIRVTDSQAGQILLNLVRLNGHGIVLQRSMDHEVAGNTVWNSSQVGIASGQGERNRFLENVVMSSGYHGFYLVQSQDEAVNRNIAFDNGRSGLLLAQPTSIVASGNRFLSNQKYGIVCLGAKDCDFDALNPGVQPLPGDNELAGNLVGAFLEK